ncbi:phage holin family protein [Pseudofulvibacter geojedonensis]|uniref:Phage holin family protein n=1 Tax=Pseudofulvibacter geojedonensis TaxID=1123758 RepID=A0ABW3I5Q9_9FLAO
MNYILRILLSALAVFVLAHILPGITVSSYISAVVVAVLLGFLNTIIRPVLVVLTIPVTIVTLGLFLLVINAIIVMLAGYFVSGFTVSGLLPAIVFSVLLSISQSILHKLVKEDKKS